MDFRFKDLYIIIGIVAFILLPNFLLAIFSVDTIVATSLKKLVFPIFASSFIMILFVLLRPKLILLLLLPFVLLVFPELSILMMLKSSSNTGNLAAILGTNFNEAIELLSGNILWFISALTLFGAVSILIVKFPYRFRIPLHFRYLLLGLFVCIQVAIIGRDALVSYQLANNSFQNLSSDLYYFYTVKFGKVFPFNWVLNTLEYLNGQTNLENYNSTVNSFTFNVRYSGCPDLKEVHVLVIGESARKENFSLYNYKRNTNPLLVKQNDVFCFTDVITSANLTSYSFPILLTRASPKYFDIAYKEPSILKAFKDVGYKTYYISNQPISYGSIYNLYAQQADSTILLSSSLDTQTDDFSALEVLNSFINKIDTKSFIIIHTMGSHFRYNLRYPAENNIFSPTISSNFSLTDIDLENKNRLINSYDNSIIYTDFILNTLIDKLKSMNVASTMSYISDHGENLLDDINLLFGHGCSTPSKYELQIPYMIWMSTEYKNAYPSNYENIKINLDKPVSSVNLFYSTLGLANISIPNESDSLSVVSQYYDSVTPRAFRSVDGSIRFY